MLVENADEYFMKQALRQAEMAYEAGEVPIGAVVVHGQSIISRGHNQVETLKDATAHAEMIALTAAFDQLGAKYLPEATIYVTLEPCLMCCGALYWSKLDRVVFGASDPKNGYERITGQTWPFHPKTKLSRGVLAEPCLELIKQFFAEKRKG